MLRRLGRLPLIRRFRRKQDASWLLSPEAINESFGHFDSFAEARMLLPPAPRGAQGLETRRPCPEGAVQALHASIPDGIWTILEIGGPCGMDYRSHWEFMPSITWFALDLPRAHAPNAREHPRYSATLDVRAMEADLWLSAGAFQFLESSRVGDLLRSAAPRPRSLILDDIALHEGTDFAAIRNLGHGFFAPHFVYNRDGLVAEVENHGYSLADEWELPGAEFDTAPGGSRRRYSGLYFRSTAAARSPS